MKLLLSVFCWGSMAFAEDLSTFLDRLFKSYEGSVPGASVLVVQEGNFSLKKSYGLSNLEDLEVASEKTNYRLASLSKQFTALATLLLVERGKLRLDETLTEIFPEFPSYGKKIEVHHLLHHTSGLRDYEDLIPSIQSAQVNDADVLTLLMKQSDGDFVPGSQYRYSNGGYCVLSEIIAKRSGTSFSVYVEKEIFAPLQMRESRVYERDSPSIPTRAFGYSPSGNGFVRTDQSVTSATQGDGGVYTSATDFERWVVGFSTLVAPLMLQHIFTPGKLNSGQNTSYGFGWVIDTYRGLLRHSHTGSTIGFRSAVDRFPDKKLIISIFVNRANSSPWDLSKRIVDRVLFGDPL